jgi:hypothetical protein
MFINLETIDFRNAMKVQGDNIWNEVATESLRRNDRNMAVGTIAEILQHHAMKQPIPDDHLVASLYTLALQRVDFYSIALELVQAAEASDRSLIRVTGAHAEQLEEELLPA